MADQSIQPDRDIQIGSVVRLTPRSRKGQSRLREAGSDLWEVIDVRPFNGWPSVLVNPVNHTNHRHLRWVRLQGDLDFSVEAAEHEPGTGKAA